MSANELELINMIRESEDPAKAMVTAIEVICRFIALQSVPNQQGTDY